MTAMWGIHNDTLTTQLVEGAFVSIGWDPLPDLRTLGHSREELKASLIGYYPDRKPMTVAAWAGTLLRFRDEMQVGDVVVAPYRPDSTVNIGIVTSDYYYEKDAPEHRHRRKVEWPRLGVPRATLSEQARFEIGSLLTVFAVRKNVDEFRAILATTGPVEGAVSVPVLAEPSADDPSGPSQVRASRVAQYTRDFVLDRLLRDLSHQDFEEFTADLLRAMGYQARATQFSRDGGVDVIAHRDLLGIEPPLIKVQCKHLAVKVGAPEVSQLIGTLGHGELGLFVTLGSYTPDALATERARSGLRLLNGDDVVSLFLQHYADLATKWRARIPLTSVLAVDDAADA